VARVLSSCLQLNGEKGAQQSAQAAPGAVAGFLFSYSRDPRAKFSDCISVGALNEAHIGRGNSKSEVKLALAAIVGCVVEFTF
jgi:hypothetical protein